MVDKHHLAVVTINHGDFLCDNARRSFKAAAKRWGAAYVELTREDGPAGVSPLEHKLLLFEQVDADRIFYIDADAIIRNDAPSPFDICPLGRLGVVSNSLERMPNYNDLLKLEKGDWNILNRAYCQSLAMGEYVNAGVEVLSRAVHSRLLARALEIFNNGARQANWPEQTAINYAVVELDMPVLSMDETWNYVHPEQVGHWDRMEKYVYHFAGSIDRKVVLPFLCWQVSAGTCHFTGPGRVYFPAKELRGVCPDDCSGTRGGFSGMARMIRGLGNQVIAHGPYCSLSKGDYRLELDLAVGYPGWSFFNRAHVSIKLIVDFGKETIARFTLRDLVQEGPGYFADFTLARNVTNFEVVISSRHPGSVVLQGYGIRKKGDPDGAADNRRTP